MNAIIVAAGQSTRLYPRTKNTPKCMLEINGESLIHRSIRVLKENGVNDIFVVLGFCHEKLRDHLPVDIHTVYNPHFASNNNMASLWMGIPHIDKGDILYQHSDLIYEPELISEFLEASHGKQLELAVEYGSVHEEAMKVEAEGAQYIRSSKEISPDRATGEWIGLARIPEALRDHLYQIMNEQLMAEQLQAYDTRAFNQLAEQKPDSIQIRDIGERKWMEIDTEEDWKNAQTIFGAGS